ncbi:MAG: hypothetical protein ACOY90_14100 [Candidatus Zhuqueibacterota bacterium]
MRIIRRIMLFSLLLIMGDSLQVSSAEKVLYYEAGALTTAKGNYTHFFDYRGNRQYVIEIGFVNFSETGTRLTYRDQLAATQQITIESCQSHLEVISLKPTFDGKFLIQFTAEFAELSTNFVSYDIVIKEVF